MLRKKTPLHVEDRTRVTYNAPYYVIGDMQFHEDWYEVVEGMFQLDDLLLSVESHLQTQQ